MYIHNAFAVRDGAIRSVIPFESWHYAEGDWIETDERVSLGMCNGLTQPVRKLHLVKHVCLSETGTRHYIQVGTDTAIQTHANRAAICYRTVWQIELVVLLGVPSRFHPFGCRESFYEARPMTHADAGMLGFEKMQQFITYAREKKWVYGSGPLEDRSSGYGMFWLISWTKTSVIDLLGALVRSGRVTLPDGDA